MSHPVSRSPDPGLVGFRPLMCTAALFMIAGCSDGNAPNPPSSGPTRLTILVQPNVGIAAGAVISPSIQVAIPDDDGRTVEGSLLPISIQLSRSDATLRGTSSRVPVRGVATFDDLTIDKSGTYSLVISTPSLGSQTSRNFEVTAGAPSTLGFVADLQTVVFAGVKLAPIAVEVRDSHGNRILTATNTITLSLTNNTGTLLGTRTKSAGGGTAIFDDLSIDSPGSSYLLTATAATLSSDTSSSIKVVRDAG